MPKQLKYPNLAPGEKEPDSPKVIKAKAKKAARDAKLRALKGQ